MKSSPIQLNTHQIVETLRRKFPGRVIHAKRNNELIEVVGSGDHNDARSVQEALEKMRILSGPLSSSHERYVNDYHGFTVLAADFVGKEAALESLPVCKANISIKSILR